MLFLPPFYCEDISCPFSCCNLCSISWPAAATDIFFFLLLTALGGGELVVFNVLLKFIDAELLLWLFLIVPAELADAGLIALGLLPCFCLDLADELSTCTLDCSCYY